MAAKDLIREIEQSIEDAAGATALLQAHQKLAKAERELKEERAKRKDAEKVLERQLVQIEQMRKPRVTFQPSKPRKTKAGDFCRLIIPDTHGAYIDPKAAAALLADMEVLRPREVILLGDHLDCGGFLAQHHVMGFVAETEYSFGDDVGACNQFFDQVQQRSPAARYDYLCGNHEARIEKWCVTQTLRHTRDAKYLRSLFSPQAVLSLDKRRIAYHTLYQYRDDLPVQGAIKRGKCHFVHGISHAKHAAAETLAKFGGCVGFGHTHRVDSHVTTLVGPGLIGAWGFGCLCVLQPYYMHGRPSGHSHAYGVQLVSAEGEFITLQVPIVNGVSLLQPLFGALVG